MNPETYNLAQVSVAVLTGFASMILAALFYNAAISNGHPFTARFLKLLAFISVLKTYEIGSAAYRASQIADECVSTAAFVVGIQGRVVEFIGYVVMILILLRPETKAGLNGAKPVAEK